MEYDKVRIQPNRVTVYVLLKELTFCTYLYDTGQLKPNIDKFYNNQNIFILIKLYSFFMKMMIPKLYYTHYVVLTHYNYYLYIFSPIYFF